VLGPVFEKMGAGLITHAKIDPDMNALREDPRFKAMLAAAEKRKQRTEDKRTGREQGAGSKESVRCGRISGVCHRPAKPPP